MRGPPGDGPPGTRREVWRRWTGIEPAWPGYRATSVLKTAVPTRNTDTSGRYYSGGPRGECRLGEGPDLVSLVTGEFAFRSEDAWAHP